MTLILTNLATGMENIYTRNSEYPITITRNRRRILGVTQFKDVQFGDIIGTKNKFKVMGIVK